MLDARSAVLSARVPDLCWMCNTEMVLREEALECPGCKWRCPPHFPDQFFMQGAIALRANRMIYVVKPPASEFPEA